MPITTLSTKGQMILPAEIRVERKLKPGTKLDVHSTPRGIYIVEVPKNPLKALSGIAKHLDIKPEDIKRMRQEDDKRRLKKLGV
jgi:AbrB family looped-hinge helix DNA binding protein